MESAEYDLGRLSHICCSFCGKSEYEIIRIIAGTSVFICNECTTLSFEMVEEAVGNTTIQRSIRFPPEYRQAGMSLLSRSILKTSTLMLR